MSYYVIAERVEATTVRLKAKDDSKITARYRGDSATTQGIKQIAVNQLKFDLTEGYSEQIIAGSLRFKLANETFVDDRAQLYRNVDPTTGVGILSGQIRYGTGEAIVTAWPVGVNNTVAVQSLTTTVDIPPTNQVSGRIPVSPIRAGSVTMSIPTIDHGNITERFSDAGVIETALCHGTIDYVTGFFNLSFHQKTKMTDDNREGIEAQLWYSETLEYNEGEDTYINVPVWISHEGIKYNAVAYSYIPLNPEIIGIDATRLPLDGRVPIMRVGDIGIVSQKKVQTLATAIAGTTYQLDDVRIKYCELQDANGIKVPFNLYTVNYDYGRVTLGGDFVATGLTLPLKAEYRYQDMGLVRDVQINGQITFTKALTHNYTVGAVAGSALSTTDLQARYAKKFVQSTWGNEFVDEASGASISANYNDMIYPITVTNLGTAQERWAVVFTGSDQFRIIGETIGMIGTGSTNEDCAPLNPMTGVPYFVIKKEGWSSDWVNGNTLRFNTLASSQPIQLIRTVMPSEPTLLSDGFQLMFVGDIDRI